MAADDPTHTLSLTLHDLDDGARLLIWSLMPGDGPVAGALLAAGVRLDPVAGHLMRCDRLDFPPVAWPSCTPTRVRASAA